MRAIILAAGRGGRLQGVTGDRPKCLARLGAATLLERQISALRGCGLAPITVVDGYRSAEVRRIAGADVEFVHNPQFASTNSLYSLWLTRDLLVDGFLVLNCDVLFDPQLLVDLLTARYPDALLVASRGADRYSDEEMKVRIRGGRVVAIATSIDSDEADGENIGIGKFGPNGAAILVDELERIVAAGGTREWLPAAFAAFAERRPLYAVDSRGLPWIEIDFPEDYWRACSDILPAIDPLQPLRAHAPAASPAAASGRPVHHV